MEENLYTAEVCKNIRDLVKFLNENKIKKDNILQIIPKNDTYIVIYS